MINNLSKSVQFVKGVGESRAKNLSKLGIYTVEDVIFHFPREYEDRGSFKKINELSYNESNCFKAIVKDNMSEIRIRKGLSIQKLQVFDDTGVATLTWFNQAFLKNTFKVGDVYTFYGKLNSKSRFFEISNPSFEKVDTNKNMGMILPMYPLTFGISQNVMRSVIKNSFDLINDEIEDFLPSSVKERNNLVDLKFAINNIHFPKDMKCFEVSRYRLAFDELLLLQMGLMSIKTRVSSNKKGIKFDKVDLTEFFKGLPFELTNAQKRVWNEIENDMISNKVMNRLVQGDVGSGKTIVAGIGMYYAVKNGYQSAIMAPTSILAVQHYETFKGLLEKYGFKVVLLTSGLKVKEKKEILEQIKSGEADIIVGTHALIQDNVEFKKLGFIVTDEQHRFGVRQRLLLAEKGLTPDVLVMTATPIPRTLALILYGDLDISIIDELPPGRKKIETYSVDEGLRPRINKFIEDNIKEGRQAYIVCPLVEESDSVEAKSVEKHIEEIKKWFKNYSVGYLHGKMKPSEKENVMKEFYLGNLDILLSTTVIEVGVNVPNATLMIIENADKFGLAQLHQLRGRVGRGSFQSYCILINDAKTKVARERMKIMESSNDGFKIAEKDLELRGPGEFFGVRQHGIPDLKIANLFTDINILKEAGEEAKRVFSDDSELKKDENQKLKQMIIKKFKGREDIVL